MSQCANSCLGTDTATLPIVLVLLALFCCACLAICVPLLWWLQGLCGLAARPFGITLLLILLADTLPATTSETKTVTKTSRHSSRDDHHRSREHHHHHRSHRSHRSHHHDRKHKASKPDVPRVIEATPVTPAPRSMEMYRVFEMPTEEVPVYYSRGAPVVERREAYLDQAPPMFEEFVYDRNDDNYGYFPESVAYAEPARVRYGAPRRPQYVEDQGPAVYTRDAPYYYSSREDWEEY